MANFTAAQRFVPLCLLITFGGVSAAFAEGNDSGTIRSWSAEASYSASVNNPDIRDVDIASVGIRTWLVERPVLSLGVQAGLIRADGVASENRGQTHLSADANGVYLGMPVRLTVNNSGSLRPFAELAISGIATDRNWPDPDRLGLDKARFYARFDAALGAEFDVAKGAALGFGIQISHISNGKGVGPDNLNFDGVGGFVSLTRRY